MQGTFKAWLHYTTFNKMIMYEIMILFIEREISHTDQMLSIDFNFERRKLLKERLEYLQVTKDSLKDNLNELSDIYNSTEKNKKND